MAGSAINGVRSGDGWVGQTDVSLQRLLPADGSLRGITSRLRGAIRRHGHDAMVGQTDVCLLSLLLAPPSPGQVAIT